MLSGWESVGNQTKGEGARKGSRSVLPRFTNCLNSSFIWGAVNIRDRWTACVCFLWRVRNRLRTNCQLWTQSAIRNKKKGPWLARWNPPWASILLLVKEKLQFPSCTTAASEVDADGRASQREALKTKMSLPLPQWPGQLEWFPPAFLAAPRAPWGVQETGILGLSSSCYKHDHDGQIPAWLVGYGLLRCFICFISHQFPGANAYNPISSESSESGFSLSGGAWSRHLRPVYSDRERPDWPRGEGWHPPP